MTLSSCVLGLEQGARVTRFTPPQPSTGRNLWKTKGVEGRRGAEPRGHLRQATKPARTIRQGERLLSAVAVHALAIGPSLRVGLFTKLTRCRHLKAPGLYLSHLSWVFSSLTQCV